MRVAKHQGSRRDGRDHIAEGRAILADSDEISVLRGPHVSTLLNTIADIDESVRRGKAAAQEGAPAHGNRSSLDAQRFRPLVDETLEGVD